MNDNNQFYRRFDKFQKQAVQSIESDFSSKSNGRFLLVIPTAGGKTFTAVKAINQLFEAKILDESTDKVVWTAHRIELLTQAKETFDRFDEIYKERKNYKDRIVYEMIGSIAQLIRSDDKIKLAVIDEAHHGAANSYAPIFEKPDLGVLGLTATPSRHDGKPLDFERESYSIGFPDLVKKGIIIKPKIVTIDGGFYEFGDLTDDTDLEVLNNKKRNKKIIDAINKGISDYKKVIIYVGTKKHVASLYGDLLNSSLQDKYDSISYITGEGNSRNQVRQDFIEEEKKYDRSILVNVQVLTEGYDDPSVNTVVMATPTRSKLYYMQAIGRAIRQDPNNPGKTAYILEVEDDLPNIRYRINNRWLFADISDSLEPEVVDIEISHNDEFLQKIDDIYANYNINRKYKIPLEFDSNDRYTMLLFKQYEAPGVYGHYPILMNKKNRTRVSNMFNFLSDRMRTFRSNQTNSEVVFKMLGNDGIPLIPEENGRKCIFNAMENAVPASTDTVIPGYISNGYPWITFVAFQYRVNEHELPDDLMEFIKDMVNKDVILDLILTKNYEKGSYLIKFPLPLKSSIGRIVTEVEFRQIEKIIDNLMDIKDKRGDQDHILDVQNMIANSVLPVEQVFSQSIVLIARYNKPYNYLLS